MTDHEPDACPNCGEPFDVAVPASVPDYERDDDGRVIGPVDERPRTYMKNCSIGAAASAYAGWDFYHGVGDD